MDSPPRLEQAKMDWAAAVAAVQREVAELSL